MIPNFEAIEYINGAEKALDNKEEETTFLVLFLDILKRGFSDFYWRVSVPGSFYEHTPFFWVASHNSDLETRTPNETKLLLSQDLSRTLCPKFWSTPAKMVEFYQTAYVFCHPVSRAFYQNHFEMTPAQAFAAYIVHQASLQAALHVTGGLVPGQALLNEAPANEALPDTIIQPADSAIVSPLGEQQDAVGGSATGPVFLTPRTERAFDLSHVRQEDLARRSIAWSAQNEWTDAVLRQPILGGAPHPNAHLRLMPGPGNPEQQQATGDLAQQTHDAPLAAEAGTTGGGVDLDILATHKRNRGEDESADDSYGVHVKRLKKANHLVQETQDSPLVAEGRSTGGGVDEKIPADQKRVRTEWDSSDESDGVGGSMKRQKK